MRLWINSDCIISCLSVVASWISKKGWESVPIQFKTTLILNIIDLSNIYVNYFYGFTFFISFHHGARQIPASLEFFLCSSAYQFLELHWLSKIICQRLFHSIPSQFTACHTCSHLPPPTLHYVSFTPHTSLCSFSICLATSDSLDCRIWGAAFLKKKKKTLKHKPPNLLFPMLMPSPFWAFLQSHRVLLSALKGSNIWK